MNKILNLALIIIVCMICACEDHDKTPLQTFALDIKPFDVWQIKTNTGETGILLVLESRTETINNTPFAEIKFKVKKIIP